MKTTNISKWIGLAVMISAVHSNAYDYVKCSGNPVVWPSPSATMRAAAGTFPVGDPYRTELDHSIDRWNENPSDFRFSLLFGDSSVAVDNGQNEVWATNSELWLDGAPATCVRWRICDEWVEADVIFDANDTSWTSSSSKSQSLAYTGSRRTFQTTALHELGHALGLKHENATYNIMGQDWDHVHCNGSTLHFYSGEDANNGAVFLYGMDSVRRQDVGVVHWRWTGSSGQYSTHGRTRIKSSSGAILAQVPGTSDDPIYYVNAGQTVLLELSFENNGADTQSPETGFFVSSNDLITTYDDRIATATPTLGRNTVYTRDQRLVIPSDLVSGSTHYLGAIVDVNGAISEVNEQNNATYVGIRIN